MDITRRDHKQTFQKPTTQANPFQLKPFQGYILEVEDEHFHHDSAVLLPNYPPDNRPVDGPSYGLAVLAECLKHQSEKPEQKVLFLGHADTSGADQYNLDISLKRAQCVLHAILGERAEWVKICEGQHKVEDYQLILTWVADVYGWDCDPQGVDNDNGSKTQAAVKSFQTIYNQAFQKSIPVDGVVAQQTWGAIFDLYMDMLENLCETDNAGLAQLRAKLNFLGPKVVGCGENWPIEQPQKKNYRSQINRRVEILFFDPGQEPKLDCHPGKGCTPVLCEIYNLKMYRFTVLPVLPSAPKPIEVFLKLSYVGPDDAKTEFVFPPDFPVTVVWKDNSTHPAKVQKDGLLQFGVPRSQGSFTLTFDTSDIYVSAGADGSSGQEKTGHASDLAGLHKNKCRFFKTPEKWTLKQSDWTAVAAPHYDASNFLFNLPMSLFGVTLGSSTAPEGLKLDPHWSYVRFEFFDRYFGHSDHNDKRINIPASLIDGWRTTPANATPDTRSHWTIRDDQNDKSVHAIPWILQFQEDRTADARPDKNIQLGFKTDAGTFVISDSATARRIDAVTDANQLKPSADRLKLYDLPKVWKSQKYYTRFSDNTGEFFDKASTFEGKITASTSADTPLIFSLDDIVLTDKSLTQAAVGGDQLALIFFHQFKKPASGGGAISPDGVYTLGNDATKTFFPYSDIKMPVKYYVNDYPDWTRLVIVNGNMYEAFSERTPDNGTNEAIGARAAVNWVDEVAAGKPPLTQVNPRPSLTKQDFFAIQPFFSQDIHQVRSNCLPAGTYQEWVSPVASYSGFYYGRFDLTLLRCCDHVGDDEAAVNMHFFRFHFDFTTPPATNSDGSAFNPTSYKQKMLTNIPTRWNGPETVTFGDGSSSLANPGDFLIKPQTAGALKLQAKPYFYAQDVPQPRAHFRLNIINIPRANMGSSDGVGNFSAGNEAPMASGWFTAAHETGHGNGLPDEYNERWSANACSYEFPGFGSQVPADPYSIVSSALMMEGVFVVEGRYFWHGTEWMRTVLNAPLQVESGGHKFLLPAHASPANAAPTRTFVHFPAFIESRASTGTRGLFDLYLFALGDDPYRERIKGGVKYDGLLCVLVKIRVKFDSVNAHSNVVNPLANFITQVDTQMNRRFVLTGSVGPFTFGNALVHFMPRFLVENLVKDGTPANNQYLTGLGYATPGAATQGDYTGKVNAVESNHPRHFMLRVVNSGQTGWHNQNELRLTAAQLNAAAVWSWFADMVGIDCSALPAPTTGINNAKVQSTIAQRAVPGATVSTSA
jgi:hypothetical protein